MKVRALVTISLLFILLGCVHGPTGGSADTSDSELQRFVGQKVTLHGPFELTGKFGPYIVYRNRKSVYLEPSGSGTWGPEYDAFQGKIVSVTGILRFRHFKHFTPPDSRAWAQPYDYFYFDAEKARIALD